MTNPKHTDTSRSGDLVERLRYQGYLNSDNGDWGLRNPDGPEAADLIETQAREIERLREALNQVLLHRYGDWTDIARAALAGDSHDQ